MTSYSIRNVGIVNKLDRIEKDMQDLKSRQFIGRKVLATQITFDAVRYLSKDYFGFPEGSPAQGSNVYRMVTFQAANQVNPYARLIIDFYDLQGNKIQNTSVSGSDGPKLFYLNFVVSGVAANQLKWMVDIRGPVDPKFYVQFSVAATDTGTLTSVEYGAPGTI